MTDWLAPYELCANLWLAADADSRIVLRFAVRLYALTGSDEEKLRTLQRLSASDFLAATWHRIPDRYVVHAGDTEEYRGVMLLFERTMGRYWEEAVEQAHAELPPVHAITPGGAVRVRLPLPDSLLRCETVLLEDAEGRLRKAEG